jgi:PAS domain S-box-containing protein
MRVNLAFNFLMILILTMLPMDVVLRELHGALDRACENLDRLRIAEAQARASEAKYRELFDHANDLIWVQDLEGRFIAVNEAAVGAFQLTREEMLGKRLTDLVVPEFHEQLNGRRLRQLAGEETPPVEYPVRTAAGRQLWIEANSRAICDEQGRAVNLHGIARDITSRKLLEQQLRQAQKLESLGRLAGGVAHDFNNLLTVINGYASLLRTDMDLDEGARSRITEIFNAGEKAAQLTNQLLVFSRKQAVETGRIELNSLVTEMNPILRWLVGANVEIVFGLKSAAAIEANAGQMQQVIMNLAVNARDAMPAGGRLSIASYDLDLSAETESPYTEVPPGNYAALSVVDTGIGMDRQTLSRLFEPFFTTKDPGRGTGLGLATAYAIVKQGGGYIHVDSVPGQGTTFTILMPRCARETPSAVPRQDARPDAKGAETILLVEDEAHVRGFVSVALRSRGYRVIEAATGEQALLEDRNHAGPIALLITDSMMPGIGGNEVAERVLSRRPETRVLFISGYPMETNHDPEGSPPGAFYLQKPFSPASLAHKVREAIES